jgi:hypothetical protein
VDICDGVPIHRKIRDQSDGTGGGALAEIPDIGGGRGVVSEHFQLWIIIKDQFCVIHTVVITKVESILNNLNLPHDLPMELRDLVDGNRVHGESKDLILGIGGRMNASHEHLAGAVQLVCAGRGGVFAIEVPNIVLELSIRSTPIARGPAVAKLIGEGDQETGVCGSWSVDLVTKELAIRDEGGVDGGVD